MRYDDSNIFARILRGELPCHRVYEDDGFLVIMDVMPQAEGHTLILPKAPAVTVLDAEPAMLARLLPLGQRVAKAATQAFTADGITMFLYNGEAGGQSVFHMHYHVVPRKKGIAMITHGAARADDDVLAEHARRLAECMDVAV